MNQRILESHAPYGLAASAARSFSIPQKLPPPPQKNHGFTLVELLTTIGIIALLISILLPTLTRARESAKSITCLSNLRQMAIAAQSYVAANRGYYPFAFYGGSDGTFYSWDFTVITAPDGSTQIIPGLLWQGKTIERIQQCPSYDGTSPTVTDPYTGYNYNTSYVGHGDPEPDGTDITPPAKMSQIHHPAQVAMFGDGQYGSGMYLESDKYMRAPFPNPGDITFTGRFAGTQGFRHLGKTNVVFCDGHAESLGNRFTNNTDGAENVAPGTGFLSPDNSAYGG